MCLFRSDQRRAVTALIALGLTFGGCRRQPTTSLDDDAREYVRLAVALGERDPDALDFYAGPSDWVADVRSHPPTSSQIGRRADELLDSVGRHASSDQSRAADLTFRATAIRARIDLLEGRTRSFDAESRAFFGLVAAPPDVAGLARIRSAIAARVGGNGSLADRYAAFAHRFVVAPAALPAVMQAAVAQCRAHTIDHLALPAGERVTIEYVRDRPWSALSIYRGGGWSVMQVNTDFAFTIDQVVQVACHETYPGHHVRSTLVSSAAAPGRGFPERLAQLTFSPDGLVSEATATMAADLAFSPDERARVEKERLCPLARVPSDAIDEHIAVERLVADLQIVQPDIARRYLDGQLEFARAGPLLEEQALVPHAEALIKYINQYRSYVMTYTTGRAIAGEHVAACAGGRSDENVRWRCFETEMLKRRF